MTASRPLPVLRSGRLVLRGWRDDDLAPFAALNADPEVMEHLPGLLDRDRSDAMVGRIRAHFAREGFGLWAVEVPGQAPFIGFVGLSRVPFDAHFTPAVEVGWRLGRAWWGNGYATEAARAALAFGFGQIGLDEIVSFTVAANRRSQAVMERIGMVRDPADDFELPQEGLGRHLRSHVLFRMAAPGPASAPVAGGRN